MKARLPLLLSLAALLLIAVVVAHGRSAVTHGRGLVLTPAPPRQQSVTQPVQRLPGSGGEAASVAGISIGVILVLLAVVLMAAALIGMVERRRRVRLRGRSSGDLEPADDAPEITARALLRGARYALAELRRTTGPPSDAVQRAWLAMETAAGECGTARDPAQTPTEFTSVLLSAHEVDPTAVTTLLTRYQRARFGDPDSVTSADADAAETAIDRIITDLTRSAAEVSA
jgi:hypothetical protein